LRATQRIVTPQAIKVLTIKEKATFNAIFTPHDLMQHTVIPFTHHFENYTHPMLHPVTGEAISSYKKLMHYPETAKNWQNAFGKYFGGMAQGDNKMGHKGTNAMFVIIVYLLLTHGAHNHEAHCSDLAYLITWSLFTLLHWCKWTYIATVHSLSHQAMMQASDQLHTTSLYSPPVLGNTRDTCDTRDTQLHLLLVHV
jgi:hypothetical protein